jgi:membrane-bound ClpP family serine protease
MSVLLLPFQAIWRLVTFIFELTGRFVAILIGFVLLVVGVIVSLTVVGAIVGIPLAIFGVLLIVRGLF